MPPSVVPRFFLYGEPPRTPGDRFLHMEEIDDRARPAAWTILPHAHADLHQVLAVRGGGGTITAEGDSIAFAAPAALLVPAGTVHGFRFEAGTQGKVLTLSDPLLRRIVRLEPALARMFESAHVLSAIDGPRLGERLDALGQEMEGVGTARLGALVAHVTLVLVALARALPETGMGVQTPLSGHADIVARFRRAVEDGFHTQAGLDAYCRRLGITMGRLRLACRAVADTTPNRIVADRIILEAKRALVYSDHTVCEIAYGLGFSDPAYFSRFFHRGAGTPPSAFRRDARGGGTPGDGAGSGP